MKPIKFKEATKNLLKPENMTDEECSSLWVYNDGRRMCELLETYMERAY